MRTNTSRAAVRTHEGARASHTSAYEALRRSVMSCMLFEGEFYEDGKEISERIAELAAQCEPEQVMVLAVEARVVNKLRHVPLYLLAAAASRGLPVANAVRDTISRPDELGELLALYWRNGRKPLTAQLKKGLAMAFNKFDAYQFAKWDRGEIRIRDVMFLTHPKPADEKQAVVFKHIANDTLQSADTWEKRLSAGQSKGEAFGELLAENRLGYMALLRNLRNMDGDVPDELIRRRLLEGAAKSKALPFRFIAAAAHAPRFERELDVAMMQAMSDMPQLPGRTIVLVDVSGSMGTTVSSKSQISRMDAACGLAMLLAGVCEESRVFSFSGRCVEVPPRRGMALRDAIVRSQPHGMTMMGMAIRDVQRLPHDRLVVITDEQTHDSVPAAARKGYILNVGSCRNGVAYGQWTHVHGFSEASVQFIHELES